MEMPGRRSTYTLLSQHPDDLLPIDHRDRDRDRDRAAQSQAPPPPPQAGGRIGAVFPSTGLQRQSSGSSFGESSPSLSGEYYVPWDAKGAEGAGSSSSYKSWAQQTEESYQLQLALALRLSSEATSADDPNFLDPMPDEMAVRGSAASAEAMSHRFWVNGCLSYFDKIPDGFYLIHGMDPYVWTVCNDLQEHGRIPSIESLKAIDPSVDSSIEVVLIDKRSDPSLKELINEVISISCSCITTEEVVEQLAKLVSNQLGGTAATEDSLDPQWKECVQVLKDCLGSVVLPMGNLAIGLCQHRALLFKVLADSINLPCRIAKGCKYCKRFDASSCLVRFGLEREYLVDLVGKPGCLCEPDSLLNGPSSISIFSPLRLPKFSTELNESYSSLAKKFFTDYQSLDLIFVDTPAHTETADDGKEVAGPLFTKHLDGNQISVSDETDERSITRPPQRAPRPNDHDKNSQSKSTSNQSWSVIGSIDLEKDSMPLKHIPPYGLKDGQSILGLSNLRANAGRDQRFMEGVQLVPSKLNTEIPIDVDDLDIPWTDLILKEKVGAGSFGTVHHADWNGSDVAVKILMEQDFHPERFKEFLREVAIMKRLRHPNIVLFMGAVTKSPHLSIVTEYLSRGSLYRLLHKSGAREVLDERRRLNMAYDVAKGMNYLHRRNPPIVHRDLKSPNLLVDKKYTVKVCDFGLSRLKANTFYHLNLQQELLSGWHRKYFAMSHQMRNLMFIALALSCGRL
ncbi:hypothetical protein Syun_016444 [Stephania yunnanensis]|uniref:non-specific serine/threonine protein kinase n=1 Tax=Stephania yunnanensis TaxID=152371 RepID=A0AAP0J4U6_9MAGN